MRVQPLALAKRFNGTTVGWEELAEELGRVDIIVSSTGSPEPILSAEQVKQRMRARRNRPLFFIDIAVPRDIDPEVNRIDNVYLYNIDDLQGIVEINQVERLKEATRAEHIIAAEALKFDGWLRTLEVVPTIVSLRKKGTFYLFAVDADPLIRYERIKLRKSETDSVTFETFMSNEQRESVSSDPGVQNLKACIREADFVFLNNGTIEEMYEEVDAVLQRLRI